MKTYSALLFVLVANSVFAGEVGALDPETSKVASGFDVALAEIGASNRWETDATDFRVAPVERVSSRQLKALSEQINAINADVSSKLSDEIEVKFSQDLNI